MLFRGPLMVMKLHNQILHPAHKVDETQKNDELNETNKTTEQDKFDIYVITFVLIPLAFAGLISLTLNFIK